MLPYRSLVDAPPYTSNVGLAAMRHRRGASLTYVSAAARMSRCRQAPAAQRPWQAQPRWQVRLNASPSVTRYRTVPSTPLHFRAPTLRRNAAASQRAIAHRLCASSQPHTTATPPVPFVVLHCSSDAGGVTGSSQPAVSARSVPPAARPWLERGPDEPRSRVIDGSLVSVDISGFTALAERLAVHGKAGAEELVQRISSVFDEPDRRRRAPRRRRAQVPRRRAPAPLRRRAPCRAGGRRRLRHAVDDRGDRSGGELGRTGRAAHVGRRPFWSVPFLPHRRAAPRAARRRARRQPASSSSRISRPRARSSSAPRRPLSSTRAGSPRSATARC